MKSEWKEYSLGELYEVHNGLSKGRKFFGRGYPFLSFSTVFNRYFLPEKLTDLVESTEKERETLSIRRGDIFITRTSETYDELGMSCVALKNYPNATFNGFTKRLRPHEEGRVLPEFIGYFLRSPQFRRKFEQIANVTTRASLSNGDLLNMVVSLPPLPIQRKISSILSALDDKIEINNAICRNLEEQTKALYKSWFVDFEPFGKQRPSNWNEKDIYSLCEIIYGAPFSSKLFNQDKKGLPLIRIRDLNKQESDVYTDEDHPKAYIIHAGDIVVGMDGEFSPYIWGGDAGLLNQRVCVFKNKRKKGSFFLYFSIKPQLEYIEQTEMATTVIHIGKKDFDAFSTFLPDEKVLDNFDEITFPFYEEIIHRRKENRRLTSIRESLLPRLMSGELTVERIK